LSHFDSTSKLFYDLSGGNNIAKILKDFPSPKTINEQITLTFKTARRSVYKSSKTKSWEGSHQLEGPFPLGVTRHMGHACD
jgi:hypothetical protein